MVRNDTETVAPPQFIIACGAVAGCMDKDARSKRKAAFELARLKAENERLKQVIKALKARLPDERQSRCLAERYFCEPAWAYPDCDGHEYSMAGPDCDGNG